MGNKEFMRKAIELSVENVKNGGGPFGAVIVKGDEIVATGVNRGLPTTTRRLMRKSAPFAKPAADWAPSTLAVAKYTHPASLARCVSVPYTGRTSTKYTTVTIRTTQPTSDSTIPLSTKNWLSPVKTARKPWKNCCPKKPSQLSTCGATRQTRLNIKPLSFQSIAAGHPPPMENPKSSVTAFGFFTIFIRIKNFLIFFILLEKKCLILPM